MDTGGLPDRSGVIYVGNTKFEDLIEKIVLVILWVIER